MSPWHLKPERFLLKFHFEINVCGENKSLTKIEKKITHFGKIAVGIIIEDEAEA